MIFFSFLHTEESVTSLKQSSHVRKACVFLSIFLNEDNSSPGLNLICPSNMQQNPSDFSGFLCVRSSIGKIPLGHGLELVELLRDFSRLSSSRQVLGFAFC